MRIAIMQPYFFPYIGYFQLINAVDIFVIFDDVNFIKQGWINRNNILINGEKHLITLALKGASSFKFINEIEVGNNQKKLIKTISQAYKKAPYFNDFFPIVENILNFESNSLAHFVGNSLKCVTAYLNISTTFVTSSCLKKDDGYKGQGKVINISKMLGADEYINAIGGQTLYSRDKFKNNHINLLFLSPDNIVYRQFKDKFSPNLSIIDVIMFNSRDEVKRMLNEFELI